MQASILKKNIFYFRKFLQLVRYKNLLMIFLMQGLTAYFVLGLPLWASVHVWGWAVPELLCMSLSTLFIASSGYLINDYYDIKIDYVNRPHSVLAGRVFSRRWVLFAHSLFNLAGVALGFLLSLKMGVFNLSIAFFLWLYSNHLKRKPLVGNLLVALLTALSLLQFVVLTKTNSVLVWGYGAFAFLATLIREIVKDVEDRKGDAAFGSKTLPILWGFRKTRRLVIGLTALLLLALLFVAVWAPKGQLALYFVSLMLLAADLLRELWEADTREAYSRLSFKVKRLMVAGMFSMVFI